LGTAGGADIQSGGTQVVEGGLASSALGTLIDGGVMEVKAGGVTGTFGFVLGPPGFPLAVLTFGGGPAFTSNGGILQLDFSQGYKSPSNAPISGFGSSPAGVTEELDLRDISFGSATNETFTQLSPTSGTLTVTDGTHTANLALLGQYSATNFSLSSDGNGTIVTDPPLVGSAGHPQLAGSHA